jgi:hypothetical protein
MSHTQTNNFQRLILLCLLIFVSMAAACGGRGSNPQAETKVEPSPNNAQGALWRDLPQRIDTSANYLFYLHGRIIEEEGVNAVSPKFGAYEYEQILQTFVNKGFIVISEARPKGTDVQQYAAKVVRQTTSLLQAGVPPQRITVVGASKGGAIAVAISTQLRNRDVNFVLLAACGDDDVYRTFRPDLYGNVLSVWDYRDDTGAGTCEGFFARSTGLNRRREVVLRIGSGHGILYRPLREWVDLVVEWANQT